MSKNTDDRALRINRDAALLVLHGRHGDRTGYEHAAAALVADGADTDLILNLIWSHLRVDLDQLRVLAQSYVYADIDDLPDDETNDG